ncbi:MAG: metalloregulator ArsR/SmtB family transcription factor [Cyanobacteria bacterium P01_D01_bin.36]
MSKLSPEAMGMVAEFFKVLSESSRLQILCALKVGTKNVTEIIEITGLGQANVSKHLKVLAQSGIVSRQPKGISVYYEIVNPFIFELCELVCDSLAIQIEQQAQPLQEFVAVSKRQP